VSVSSTPWSTRSVYLFMRIRIGYLRSAGKPIGRTVLAPTVALRVFLVRLVRRVDCGDAVPGGRPFQFDCDALDLAVVVKRFDALRPPVHVVLPATEGCLDRVGGPGVGRRWIVNGKITSPYRLG
jgi:hypothetical protein